MENIKEIGQFLEFLEFSKGCSKITVRDYREHLKKFIKIMDIKSFEDIKNMKVQDIDQFMFRLAERGNVPSTRNAILSCLRSFYDFLRKRDMVETNVAKGVECAKMPQVIKNIPTEEEFRAILEYMHDNCPVKYYTMALLLVDTGLRFSEMTNLKLKDLDSLADSSFIIIKGKGNKQRRVYISEELKAQLRKYVLFYRKVPDILTEEQFKQNRLTYGTIKDYETYLAQREKYKDYVFISIYGFKIDNTNFNRSLQNAANKVGVSTALKDISAHSLRHFFATYALDKDVRIDALAEMLGHASISTTQRYIHRSEETMIKEGMKTFNFAPSKGGEN